MTRSCTPKVVCQTKLTSERREWVSAANMREYVVDANTTRLWTKQRCCYPFLRYHQGVEASFSIPFSNRPALPHNPTDILPFLHTSYKALEKWYDALTSANSRKGSAPLPIFIVGTKIDQKRDVPIKDIDFAKKKGLPYYEISAKANYGVKDLALSVIKSLLG